MQDKMAEPFEVRMRRGELIAGAVWLLLFLTGLYSLVLQLVMEKAGAPTDDVTLNLVYFFSCFGITILIFHRFLADSLPLKPMRLLRTFCAVLLGFALYELLEIGLSILISVIGTSFSTPNDDTISTVANQSYAVMWVGAVLLAPLTEETLVRGLLFGNLRRVNRVLAYVVTALVFACMHILGYLSGMSLFSIGMNLLIYGLPGIAICVCYEYGGTLWAPIVLHMLINALGMSAMG